MTQGTRARLGLRRQLRRMVRPLLRVVRRGTVAALIPYVEAGARRRARTCGATPRQRPRICVLLFNAFSPGGTARTVLAMADHLAREHDIEVFSLIQDADKPRFDLPPGVRLTVLEDRTEAGRASRTTAQRFFSRLPSVLWHDVEQAYPEMSLWVDLQLVKALRRLEADLLVATRHGLTILLADLAPSDVVTVAQVHLATVQQHPDLQEAVRRRSRRLDAVVVLTEDERRDYEQVLEGAPTRLAHIPNAVTALTGDRADPAAKVVIAVGRLRPQKGFDLLLPAFRRVVAVRPDWTLRIFGEGSEQEVLEQSIVDSGMQQHVELRGWSSNMGEELAQASLFVLSSRSEGLPMVMLEAMSKGLPVVSFDCDYGPREIITPGVDGLLVPPEDIAGLASALLELIKDDERRAACAEHALSKAAQYAGPSIALRWSAFYEELLLSETDRTIGSRVGAPPACSAPQLGL